MAKKVETQLVISAKDLGTKKLGDVARAFRQIRQEQRETAAATDRTKVKMDELRATLAQLEVVQKSLSDRRALLDRFRNLNDIVGRSADRLKQAKVALEEFNAKQKAGETLTGKAATQFKALGTAVQKAEEKLAGSQAEASKLGDRIKELGLDTEKSQRALVRFANATDAAVRRASTAIQQLPRQQREYRAEIERTKTAEKAATRERIEAANQRIEQERAVLSRFQAHAQREMALTKALRVEDEKRREAARALVRERTAAERLVKTGFGTFDARATGGASSSAVNDARKAAIAERSIRIQRAADEAEGRLNARRNQSVSVLGRLAAALRNTSTAEERHARAVKNGAEAQRTALSLAQRVRGQLLSIAAGYVGIFGVISTGSRALNVYNERLALNTRLLVANGNSQEAAADDLRFLREEANRLGFSLTELGTNYSRLAIAGKAAGLQVEEVREIFSNFTEVARVNNLSIESNERVFRALEQILSKGKVQAEELRGQLGDVLPGAYTTFARALQNAGVIKSFNELDKLLEQGRVSSKALLAFSKEYAAQVQGQVVPASRNMSAQLGRLNTAFDDFLEGIAKDSLVKAVSDVAAALEKFLKSAEGAEFARELGNLIRFIGAVALGAAKNLGLIITAAKILVGINIARWAYGSAKGLVTLGKDAKGALKFVADLADKLKGMKIPAGITSLAGLGGAATLGLGAGAAAAAIPYAIYASGMREVEETSRKFRAELEKNQETVDKATTAAAEAARSADALSDAQMSLKHAEDQEAKAKAEATKKGTDHAKSLFEQAKAAREAAEKKLKDIQATHLHNVEMAKAAKDEAERAIVRNRQLATEAVARISAAKATIAQAKANLELIQSQSRMNNDGMGGRSAQGGALLGQGITKTVAEEALKAAEADLKAANEAVVDATMILNKPLRTTPKIDPNDILLDGNNKDGSTKKDKTEDNAREAAEFLANLRQADLEQQKDILDKREGNERASLEISLQLLKEEYDEKRRAADKLADKLRENNQNKLADEIIASKKSIDAQQAAAEKQAQTDTNREVLLKQIEQREREINNLIDLRDRKLADIERRKETNAITDYDAQQQTYKTELEFQQKVLEKLKALQAFLATADLSLLEKTEIEDLLVRMDEVPGKVEAVSEAMAKLAEYQEDIANGLTDTAHAFLSGIADMVKGVGSFKDALKSAWDTFRSFIADFLVGIGKAILKVLLLKAIENAAGSSSWLGAAAKMAAGSQHTGGISGQQAKTRNVNPMIFAAAQRYHTGGVVGLGPDEVPIVAKRGEEMLTENDPRHRNNGGLGGQAISIYNAVDVDSIFQAAGSSPKSVKAIVNLIRANQPAFQAALGR
jgi:tape measure domain-containing protein